MNDALVTILATGVLLAVPVMWAALGEFVVEKSGVLNIGVEGVMLIGAAGAAFGLRAGSGSLLATLLAALVGGGCGLVLAFLYVTRRTDQIVTGLMFNLAALGLTSTLFAEFLNGVGEVSTDDGIAIPGLSSIPVVGEAIFSQSLLFYLVVAAALVIRWLFSSTWYGLHLTAAGEAPLATETAGIDVVKVRYSALFIGAGLAGVGGASIVILQSGAFLPNMTAGQGYIALAVVVLGRFRALPIVVGALLFGVVSAFQYQAQSLDAVAAVPLQLWLALPYLVTVLTVALSRSARYPKGVGEPFVPASSR